MHLRIVVVVALVALSASSVDANAQRVARTTTQGLRGAQASSKARPGPLKRFMVRQKWKRGRKKLLAAQPKEQKLRQSIKDLRTLTQMAEGAAAWAPPGTSQAVARKTVQTQLEGLSAVRTKLQRDRKALAKSLGKNSRKLARYDRSIKALEARIGVALKSDGRRQTTATPPSQAKRITIDAKFTKKPWERPSPDSSKWLHPDPGTRWSPSPGSKEHVSYAQTNRRLSLRSWSRIAKNWKLGGEITQALREAEAVAKSASMTQHYQLGKMERRSGALVKYTGTEITVGAGIGSYFRGSERGPITAARKDADGRSYSITIREIKRETLSKPVGVEVIRTRLTPLSGGRTHVREHLTQERFKADGRHHLVETQREWIAKGSTKTGMQEKTLRSEIGPPAGTISL